MTRLSNAFDQSTAATRCKEFRKRILDMSQTVSALHIAPAFSCLEMVDAIYFGLMRREADGSSKDRFIMSKGHGCLAQYVALERLGVLSKADLDSFCTRDGLLGAHPDYGTPGVEASTGALGHGLAIGLGMAMAERQIAGKNGDPGVIYVVVSDGELQEGSTWEAFMQASSFGVSNLVVMIDNNDFQSLGRTSETHPSFYPVVEKLAAFGWDVAEVNGHDAGAVVAAVQARDQIRPFCVVGRTIKGRGVEFMEEVLIWHYRSPNPEEYALAVAGLTEVRA